MEDELDKILEPLKRGAGISQRNQAKTAILTHLSNELIKARKLAYESGYVVGIATGESIRDAEPNISSEDQLNPTKEDV